MKSIILTWYLLISFGHAQHAGRKVEDDDTESSSTAVNALYDATDHLSVDLPFDDAKTSNPIRDTILPPNPNAVARGNLISRTKMGLITYWSEA